MGDGDLPPSLAEVLRAGAGPPSAQAFEMGRLWAAWPELVGPAVAAHAEPSSLRERVLRVRADSPAWATEIGYLREEIRRRANDHLGREVVTEVRVWTGPGRVRPRPEGGSTPATAARVATGATGDPRAALARAQAAWRRRRRGVGRAADRAPRDGKNAW